MVQKNSYFRAEGNQSKERKSEKVAGLEADFDSIPFSSFSASLSYHPSSSSMDIEELLPEWTTPFS